MNSADTADQMMKMTLEGIQVAAEVGLKAGGMAARSLAVTLYRSEERRVGKECRL